MNFKPPPPPLKHNPFTAVPADERVCEAAAHEEYANTGPLLAQVYEERCTTHNVPVDANVRSILETNSEHQPQYKRTVISLDFSSNYLSFQPMQALLETISDCTALESLSFEGNYLKSEIMPSLIKAVKTLPALVSLNLANNSTLGFSAAKLLMQLVKTSGRLVFLELDGTGLTPQAKETIAGLLIENATRQSYWAPTSPFKSSVVEPDLRVQSIASTPSPRGTSSARTPGTKKSWLKTPPKMPDSPIDWSLEERVAQNVESNTALREVILSEELRLLGLEEQFNTKVQGWHVQLKNRHEDGHQAIDSFDDEYKGPTVYVGYSTPKLIRDCELELTASDLKDMQDLYHAHDPSIQEKLTQIKPLLDELLLMETTHARAKEIGERLSSICYLREHEEAIPAAVRCHTLLHSETLSVPFILRNVRATDAEIEQLIRSRDEQKAKTAAALGMMDPQYEKYHEKCLHIQEQLLVLAEDRIRLLKDIKGTQALSAQAKGIREKLTTRLQEADADAGNTVGKIQAAADALNRHRKHWDKTFAEKEADYKVFCERSKERIRENEALQEDVFAGIKKKFIELEDLSKSRIKEVELYLKERDKIDAVRAEYAEMCKVWDAHMELINGTTHCVQVATNACVDFVHFFEKPEDILARAANECFAATQEECLKEQKLHMTYFTQYMKDLGDLIIVREKKALEFERRIREMDYSINMADETQDPNKGRYEDQKKDLMFKQAQIAQKLEALYLQVDKALADFEETGTEETVKADGGFVHPNIQMHEAILARRHSMLAKARDIHKSEESYLEEAEDELQQSTRVLQQAKEIQLHSLVPALATPRKEKKGAAFTPGAAATPRKNLIFS
uniref:Uncharacterized protein n=1 Tax=Eutreptiella gymnastica TaxID=73025 RepID=A0A7S4G7C4_9EUGL